MSLNISNSELFDLAKVYIPGGVNSPVRSFNAVGGTPFFTDRGDGCYLYDIESKRYIDYICSWGANIVGHANPYVVTKVMQALAKGFSFGTPTELEVEFVKRITQLMPHVEKLRLVSSGTEAVMTAIRLARGYTKKNYIIKFNGCYHGHTDSLLVKAGSGLATFNNPSSSGVPLEAIKYTIVLEYNSIAEISEAFTQYGQDIAGVILEPFAGNMNLVRPTAEFITTLRKLCDEYNSLLIFDEVMTGFRVALGGAKELLNVTPDLTTLGKVISGGMPLAAFGGRAEIMDYLAPLGSVYQAGTLSGNPIAVSCGLANLDLITAAGFYSKLNQLNERLTSGLANLAKKYKLPFSSDFVGGMFGFYFADKVPQNFIEAKLGNSELFNQFFHYMLDYGIYFAPSMYEAGFICSAHNNQVIDETLQFVDAAFAKL